MTIAWYQLLFGGVFAAIVGACISYFFNRKLKKEFDTSAEIEILADREALYRKIDEILRKTKSSFLDTTWGPPSQKPTPQTEKALTSYLEAKSAARKRGVSCQEIFTGEGFQERIQRAEEDHRDGNYSYKVIDKGYKLAYMPDFAVADEEHIVISNVGATASGQYRFVYIRSVGLAHILKDWFVECWKDLPGQAYK